MKKRCSKTWGTEQKKNFLLKPDKTDRGAAKQTAPTNAEQEVQLSLCEEQIIGTPGSDTLGEFTAEP